MDFRTVKISDICLINPDTYSTKEQWPFVNYLDTGNLTQGSIDDIQFIPESQKLPSRARRKVLPGDILYSTVRPNQKHYGMLNSVKENMLVSTGFCVLRATEKANNNFIYYLLTQEKITNHLHGIAENSTSAYPALKPSDIGNLTIEIPSLATQESIANILISIDKRIEHNRKLAANLESIAQAIFKSWFVDFDPVKAKMEGKDTGLDPEIDALFPDKLVESELGLIPEGWEIKQIGDLFQFVIGGAWGVDKPDDTHNIKVAVIRGTDLPHLKNGNNSSVPYRYETSKKASSRSLQEGDITLEISGGSNNTPTGRNLYISKHILDRFNTPVIPASFCRLLRPIDMQTGIYLSQHIKRLYDTGGTWLYQNRSTGISNFQVKYFLNNEKVILPKHTLLFAFFKIINPILNLSHLNEVDKLSSIRDLLLPRLMSGELRVEDANELIESTM